MCLNLTDHDDNAAHTHTHTIKKQLLLGCVGARAVYLEPDTRLTRLMDEREKEREEETMGEGALPKSIKDVESAVLENCFTLIEAFT
jgi:hypothetical protein